MPNTKPLINAANAPKDQATGKVTNYQEWMLDSYIKVGRELNGITDSAKDVADKLEEQRNFVHHAKELGYTAFRSDSTIRRCSGRSQRLWLDNCF